MGKATGLALSNENRYHYLAMINKPRQTAPSPPAPAQCRQAPDRTTAQALLGTAEELIIEHGGRDYRLRFTQQGKLILTA
jgi:hemin uptake protein HemP